MPDPIDNPNTKGCVIAYHYHHWWNGTLKSVSITTHVSPSWQWIKNRINMKRYGEAMNRKIRRTVMENRAFPLFFKNFLAANCVCMCVCAWKRPTDTDRDGDRQEQKDTRFFEHCLIIYVKSWNELSSCDFFFFFLPHFSFSKKLQCNAFAPPSFISGYSSALSWGLHPGWWSLVWAPAEVLSANLTCAPLLEWPQREIFPLNVWQGNLS